MTQAYCQVCGANRPHRPRTIEVRNLGGVSEVLRLAAKTLGRKKIPRSTLQLWRRPTTVPPFPKPVKKLKAGELFDLAEVKWWLEQPRYVGDARKPAGLDVQVDGPAPVDERSPFQRARDAM